MIVCTRCGHTLDAHCGCGAHCLALVSGPARRLVVPKVLQKNLGEFSDARPICRCDGLTVETTPGRIN